MSTTTTSERLAAANTGIDALLNDDIDAAKHILTSDPDSAVHLVGYGFACLLQAGLGMESSQINEASEILVKAEAACSRAKASRGDRVKGHWWPEGTEWTVLIGNAVMGHAMAGIFTESTSEYLKAVYRLNQCVIYRICACHTKP
jgi:hypothetical protein